jgi:hypothetical protein
MKQVNYPRLKTVGLSFQFSFGGLSPKDDCDCATTEDIWLVDIGWTNPDRGFSLYLTAAYFQQRLTPCSLGCRHPHAIGSDGWDFSDSAVD